MHHRLTAVTACGTAVAVALSLNVLTSSGALAQERAPEFTESALQGIDPAGVTLDGARAGSNATVAVTQSSTQNLPGLLRAPDARSAVSQSFTQSVAFHVAESSGAGGFDAGGDGGAGVGGAGGDGDGAGVGGAGGGDAGAGGGAGGDGDGAGVGGAGGGASEGGAVASGGAGAAQPVSSVGAGAEGAGAAGHATAGHATAGHATAGHVDAASDSGAVVGSGGMAEAKPATGDLAVVEETAPLPDAAGSVTETTEDGIAIAGLSGEMELPEDNPAVVGLTFDERADVEFEIRSKTDGEWSDWSHIHAESSEEGEPGTDPYYLAQASSLQIRVLGDAGLPSGTSIMLVDPKRYDSDAEAVLDNVPVFPDEDAAEDSGDAGAGDADGDAGAGDADAGDAGGDAGAGDAGDAGENGGLAEVANANANARHEHRSQCTAGGGCQCPQCAATSDSGAATADGDAATAGDDAAKASDDAATADGDAAGAAGAVANAVYQPGSASAEVVPTSKSKAKKPKIRSRDSWGANESLRRGSPSTGPKPTAVIVHHTDGQNDYAAEDVPSILRGIYTFHVNGRGWADVGYNVLADSYGRLWEGRAGGVNKGVVGAHAAGFNTGTWGISVLGSFGDKAPPRKTRDAVAHAAAWKLSQSGTDADARTTVNGKRMRTISGHRDVGQTACPGDAFYAKFGEMRKTASEIQDGRDLEQEAKDKKAEEKAEKEKEAKAKEKKEKEAEEKEAAKKEKAEKEKSEDTSDGLEGGVSDGLTGGVSED